MLNQPELCTSRILLESVTIFHAVEFFEFLSDSKLYTFIPEKPLTLEQSTKRCELWSKRRSPDGSELWLNWLGREKTTKKIVAHLQAGVDLNKVATIAYVVSVAWQRKGIAYECMTAVIQYLQDELKVQQIKAWSDTRNEASHRLVKKLGMHQVAILKNADVFNGATSDEFVFSNKI